MYELGPGVIERVADAATPQPVMAVVASVDVPLDALAGARALVVCTELRDPGNAGTVLRGAGAAGVDGVVFCDGSVDVYNPRTVRASAGALFGVPFVAGGGVSEVLERIGGWGMRRLGAVAHGGADYAGVDLTGRIALVVGNEAHGLADGTRRLLDGAVTIPLARDTESLNVGVATAVLCFEAARQRRTAPGTAAGRNAAPGPDAAPATTAGNARRH